MATDLDRAIEAIGGRMMADGGPLEIGYVEKFGQQLPYLKKASSNLREFFETHCTTHAEKEFLIDQDIRLTFGEVLAASRELAGGLVEGYGLKKGDRVGIAARNSANWLVAYMAVISAGGVATLLNGWWKGGELADGIRMVDCRYILADEQRAARLADQDIGSAEVLIFEHDKMPLEGLRVLIQNGGGSSTPLPDIDPLDPATILYTSGSTGQSKGAWSDHRAVTQAAMNYIGQTLVLFEILAATGQLSSNQPTTLVNVPLFHVTAAVPLIMQSFAIGRKMVIMPKWDAEHAMQLIEKEKVTYFIGVPLMSIEIAKHPNRANYDLTSCTSFAAGGAPRPVEHVQKIRKEMSWSYPLIGYGLTETNGVGCGNMTENYLAKPTSTGTPTKPLVDLGILDDDGNKVPQGERGEVCIRSIANFNGYWNNDDATRAAFTKDGYFRTGDIGYVDEDGYLFIVDRKKDIIIRGGENISCAEVEAVAYEIDVIHELAVIGLDDEKFGEVPAILYVTKGNVELPTDELRAYLAGKLAPFKVPSHYWQVFEALPRLGTQKIDRLTLRAEYQKILANT